MDILKTSLSHLKDAGWLLIPVSNKKNSFHNPGNLPSSTCALGSIVFSPSAASALVSSVDADMKVFHHANFDFPRKRPIWSHPVKT